MRTHGFRQSRAGWALYAGVVPLALAGLAACSDGEADPFEAVAAERAEHAAEGRGPVIALDSAALALSGIEIRPVEVVSSNRLPVTGTITYDANRVSHVGPKTEGRIVALRADLGSRVGGGDPLAILESAEVGAIRAELFEVRELAAIARENYERERRLEAQGISSRREMLEAEAELRRAEAALQSARERLRILGAELGEGGQFAIAAPFAGVVVQKHASLGEVVGPEDQVFTVADLARLWIELDVYERDLREVAEGQPVRVTTPAYPGRVFPGRIVYLGDILDPETRTVRARVEIINRDGALKPGMFARAEIETSAGAGAGVAAVPRGAVQDIEGRTMVWIPGDERGEFRAVPVEVGEDVGDGRVVIRSGLRPGTRVVTSGAFTLKAELSRGHFGGHTH